MIERILIAAGSMAALCIVMPATAETIADFYKGKNVTIVVGSAPGGGYDAYGRLVGAHLGKHIPGKPNIIVQNMPGAGQSLAANFVYSIAPKDGTAITGTSPGAFLYPLTGGPNIQYDPLKLRLIGSANTEHYACFIRTDAPVKSYKEVFEKEVILGVSSGSTRDMPAITMGVLKPNYKMVTGYKGSKDVILAIERKEVHGLCGLSYASFRTQNPDFKERGIMTVLAQESVKGHPELNADKIPKVIDFAKTDDDRKALSLVFNQGEFGRPFAVAPDVPADRLAALRKAFLDTMKDPELIADAKKRKLDVDFLSGEAAEEAVKAAYATPKAAIERVRMALSAGQKKKQ
jgi:tripartite-type tricarboxylate transporter receptor subunit TctC